MNEIEEPRLISETGTEARVAGIVEPILQDLGFRLVRVRLSAMNGQTLQIMAERPDGTISVADCETISRAVSPVLDIEDPVSGTYHLEVSSPGIDRPLVRVSDYRRWAGHVAKLETRTMINGRKRYKGRILETSEGNVVFHRDEKQAEEEERFTLPLSEIAEARLVLTDELIREALKRDKALREANGIDTEDNIDNA